MLISPERKCSPVSLTRNQCARNNGSANLTLSVDDEIVRQARAISVIAEYRRNNSLVISAQVLQEYYAAATRKLHVDPALAQAKVEAFARGRVVRFTEREVIASIELHSISVVRCGTERRV
jgi:predicted nucleic acid-binding protein